MEKSLCINELKEKRMIPSLKKDSNPKNILFDLKASSILYLFKDEIKKHQINLNRICKYSNPNLFNSYIRDKNNQRKWSCIYK